MFILSEEYKKKHCNTHCPPKLLTGSDLNCCAVWWWRHCANFVQNCVDKTYCLQKQDIVHSLKTGSVSRDFKTFIFFMNGTHLISRLKTNFLFCFIIDDNRSESSKSLRESLLFNFSTSMCKIVCACGRCPRGQGWQIFTAFYRLSSFKGQCYEAWCMAFFSQEPT